MRILVVSSILVFVFHESNAGQVPTAELYERVKKLKEQKSNQSNTQTNKSKAVLELDSSSDKASEDSEQSEQKTLKSSENINSLATETKNIVVNESAKSTSKNKPNNIADVQSNKSNNYDDVVIDNDDKLISEIINIINPKKNKDIKTEITTEKPIVIPEISLPSKTENYLRLLNGEVSGNSAKPPKEKRGNSYFGVTYGIAKKTVNDGKIANDVLSNSTSSDITISSDNSNSLWGIAYGIKVYKDYFLEISYDKYPKFGSVISGNSNDTSASGVASYSLNGVNFLARYDYKIYSISNIPISLIGKLGAMLYSDDYKLTSSKNSTTQSHYGIAPVIAAGLNFNINNDWKTDVEFIKTFGVGNEQIGKFDLESWRFMVSYYLN